MKKLIVMLMLSAGFTVMAQNAYYYNSNGSSAGRSTRVGNTTYYYNSNGSSAGRSTTIGNTTYHYNSNGSSAGRTSWSGNTAYHYNSNGSSAGRSNLSGNNVYHYNSNVLQDASLQTRLINYHTDEYGSEPISSSQHSPNQPAFSSLQASRIFFLRPPRMEPGEQLLIRRKT